MFSSLHYEIAWFITTYGNDINKSNQTKPFLNSSMYIVLLLITWGQHDKDSAHIYIFACKSKKKNSPNHHLRLEKLQN